MSHARSLIAVTALAGSLFACAAGVSPPTDHDVQLTPNNPTLEPGSSAPTTTDLDVRLQTRDAWLALAQSTHFYAISLSGNVGDTAQAEARLLDAGDDLATQTGVLLGDGSAADLATLLRQRAQIVVSFVEDTEDRDGGAVTADLTAWRTATSEVASFFTSRVVDVSRVPSPLQSRLDALDVATQDEISARAAGDFAGEVGAADRADDAALLVGDTLARDFIATFRAKLAKSPVPAADQARRLELRAVLAQRAFWLRAFMIDQLQGDSAQPELDRAITAHMTVSDMFTQAYGKTVGDQVELHFHDITADGYAFLLASESGDASAIDAIHQKWLEDAASFAEYLGTTVASLTQPAVQRVLDVEVDRTLASIVARRAGDWSGDASDYQMVLDNTRTFGDVLATSLAGFAPGTPH